MKFSAQGFSFDWRKRVAFLCPPQWTISQAPKEAARVQIHAHSMGSLSYVDGENKLWNAWLSFLSLISCHFWKIILLTFLIYAQTGLLVFSNPMFYSRKWVYLRYINHHRRRGFKAETSFGWREQCNKHCPAQFLTDTLLLCIFMNPF